jgi:1,4-alpha-glucan branching enzyme
MGDVTLMVCNMTPVPREGYVVGVPKGGEWVEALNSDAEIYGGGNVGNGGAVQAAKGAKHGFNHSLTITLPPLGIVVFQPKA